MRSYVSANTTKMDTHFQYATQGGFSINSTSSLLELNSTSQYEGCIKRVLRYGEPPEDILEGLDW